MSEPTKKRPPFTFLGHSAIRFELADGSVVLIDPWIEENPSCSASLESLGRVDVILITHGHYDHVGDCIALAARYRPKAVIANFEISSWLEGQGVENVSPMHIGGSQEVLGMKVTMVRADHGSGLPGEGGLVCGGPAAGFVVRVPGGFTFYHAGDTGLFSDLELIGELYRPRLAFLPIGDRFTMDPYQAARACRLLGIQEVIPIHWGTFPLLTGTPADLEREMATLELRCRAIVLDPGDTY